MKIQNETPEWLKYAITYFYIIIYIISLAGMLYFDNILLLLSFIIFAYSSVMIFLQAHAITHNHFRKNHKFNHKLASFILFLNGPITYKSWQKKHLDHHEYFGTDRDPDNVISKNLFVFWIRMMLKYQQKWTIIFNLLGSIILSFFTAKPWFIIFLLIVYSKALGVLFITTLGAYLPHQTRFNEKIIPKWFCFVFSLGNMYHLEHHRHPHLYSLDLSITDEQTNANLKYK